jgi:DNA polymerase-4
MASPIKAGARMDLSVNKADPRIMHIDLNSCFATIEQQANPLIRNKPVAVAAYTKDYGMILAASYDAKALGIKLGTSVREARAICPGIIVLMPDPPKYREAHKRFKQVLLDYTSDVVPRSIDEFVVDFHGSKAIRQGRSLESVGHEIKERIKEELGEYVTVNVGIGTNRCLAKFAAGLHKPDGLDVITYTNMAEIYKNTDLMDLPGINRRFRARLLAAGISTPYEMFLADANFLKNFVFFSKLGYHWYQRLRGWEVDAVEWGRKTIGHQYALEDKTDDLDKLRRLLMKLCEKAGRRLRRNNLTANGVHLYLRFADRNWWHHGHKTSQPLYATQDIYRAADHLLVRAAEGGHITDLVTHISITTFNLAPAHPEQLGLFDQSLTRQKALADAADQANDRYGEFTVVPAIMADMQKVILDRIAFGNIRDMDDQAH